MQYWWDLYYHRQAAVFRSTRSVYSSRCWTRLRDWRTISVDRIGPHHWRACLPPLPAPAGASPVQDRPSGLQSLARTRAAIGLPWSTQLRRRPTWCADRFVLLLPTVWQCLRSSWQPSSTGFFFAVGLWTLNDLPDNVRHLLPSRCPPFASVSRHIFSQNHFLTIFWSVFFSSGPSSSLYYLSHFKNPGLIDWLTDW